MDFDRIKFVLSEMDGIITEHLVGIGEMNTTMFKQYCMKDFEAINLIKKDWGFAFMSSDPAVNMSLCKKRNIPFFLAERSKKDIYVNKVLRRFDLTPENVLYIGSTYSDIECIRMSGISMCPDDSVAQVRNTANYVIPVYSGAGVLSHVYDLLYHYKTTKRMDS